MVSFSFSIGLKFNMFPLDPVYVHFTVALFLTEMRKGKASCALLLCIGEG